MTILWERQAPLTDEERPALCAWLEEHGVDPMTTYRAEVIVIDCPALQCYEYVWDEDGRYITDGDVVRTRSYLKPLKSFPPGY